MPSWTTGRPGTVRLAATLEGDLLRIDVTDDGAGMSEATLSRATEPFFTTKPPGRGTGLRLTMAHGFARASGGRLTMESQVEEGTTTSVWLPAGPRTQGRRAGLKPPRAKPASILLVDDDEIVRQALTDDLRDQGYHVEACGSDAAILALLDAGVPADLLITNLNMPDQDGAALIQATRLRRPRLPVLLLTGDARNLLSVPSPGLVLRRLTRTQALSKAVADLLP